MISGSYKVRIGLGVLAAALGTQGCLDLATEAELDERIAGHQADTAVADSQDTGGADAPVADVPPADAKGDAGADGLSDVLADVLPDVLPDAPVGPVCGNGQTETGEECDDHNVKSGDGCSSKCKKEPAPTQPGMVFVPATTFAMGCGASDKDCASDEKPVRNVTLSAYFIDLTPVTAAAYAECVAKKGCTKPPTGGEQATYGTVGKEQFPVNYVGHGHATTYCDEQGKRLCTEAEWELAARGSPGQPYPWGSAAPTCGHANFKDCGDQLLPVNTHPLGATPAGVQDLAGNVWEWVHDWYGSYKANVDVSGDGLPDPEADPKGPETGAKRVLRGGSFESGAVDLRGTARHLETPTNGNSFIGFRCCKTP